MTNDGSKGFPKAANFGTNSYLELFFLTLKGVLHSQLPPPTEFRPPIEAFYTRAFQVYHIRQEKDSANHQFSSAQTSSTPNGGLVGFNNSALMRDDSSTCSNSR